MKTYRAEQTLALSGWDSGTELEINQVVTFTVTPGFRETLSSPAGYPSVENVEIRYFLGTTELHVGRLVDAKFTDDAAFTDWLLTSAIEDAEYAAGEVADDRRADAGDWYENVRV